MRLLNVLARSTGPSERRLKAPVLCLVGLSLVILSLAACTAIPSAAAVPLAEVQATPARSPDGILSGDVQATTFDQVVAAIEKLYSDRPDVNSFVVKGVTYTPATRDKVLKICHEGGLVSSEAERESQEVLACAPLIFYFYNYGQQSGAAESTDIARLLYWYTVTNHSDASKEVLTQLLHGWGIR
jgi:hypothetical protein